MAQEELTAEQVAGTIKAGDYDGSLIPLLDAIRMRFRHGTTEQKWKVAYGDEVITQDSLTLAEAAVVEKQCGAPWATIDPAASATACRAILAVHLTRAGVTFAEALDAAGEVSLAEADAAVGTYEVMRAPKGSAALTTT